MTKPTVREMAQLAQVSERLIAQTLHVQRHGFDGIMDLVFTHRATIPELTLVVDHLHEESQRAWAALEPEAFHQAVRNLRRFKAARVQAPLLDDLKALAAGEMALEDFLSRHRGARIPNSEVAS